MRALAILAAGLMLAGPGATAQPAEPVAVAAADLPFTVTLVPGMTVTQRPPGPDFLIYDMVAIDEAFVSVYVGCCANFPIHENKGAKVRTRLGGPKIAVLKGRTVEYLWTRPRGGQIHVWAQLDPTIDARTVDKVARSVRPR